MNKLTIRLLLTFMAMLSGNLAMGQTHWKNGGWYLIDGVTPASAPSSSTGSTTFFIDNGTDCSIGNANMAGLVINNAGAGTICTVTGTITVTNLTISNAFVPGFPKLSVSSGGIINVVNLNVGGLLNGLGTVNVNGGTFTQTDSFGIILVTNFNIITGNVTFSFAFVISNLFIAEGASATINYMNSEYPVISGLLTVNGNFTNLYINTSFIHPENHFTIKKLLINSTGTFNGANVTAKCDITDSLKIGGVISPATTAENYIYDFDKSGTTKDLVIFGNANVKLSDLVSPGADATYKYIHNIQVTGNGKFTIDRNLTNNAITLASGGGLLATGSPTLTATTINPIDGRLVLSPGATLAYTPKTLSLTGTNAALGYINRPDMKITLSGVTDTVRNCSLQQVTVNAASKGFIYNSSSYKIQRIDASDSVTIALLKQNDTLNISATGKALLTGNTRVAKMLDIASGGSLNSGGNLTMLDQSNLYFTTDGQITGNINWHRRYGSAGWVYFGSPFPGLNRTTILGSITGTVNFNKYVESLSTKRWVALGSSEKFVPGQGYELGISSTILNNNDTIVFTGQPTRTNVTVTGLTYTTNNGSWFDYQRGYNLVANPYTAPISVAGFFTDNPNLNAIYYWDDIGKGKGVFVTRSSLGIITPLDSVSAKNLSKVQATYLAPNQGFFVKIPSDLLTTTVLFDESRITRDVNDNFLKSAVNNYIRLKIQNASGTKNDCIIQFDDAATDAFSPGLDVFKMVSSTYPLEIYSFKTTDKFAIQTRKPVTGELHIPIGLTVKMNEKHTFSMDDFDALPLNVNPYILDKVAQRSVNLKDSVFTVTLKSDTIDNRFELVLKDGSIPDAALYKDAKNEVLAFAKEGRAYLIFSMYTTMIHIEVTDISGRLISRQYVPEAQGQIALNDVLIRNNVYILKITGNNISQTTKLLVQ